MILLNDNETKTVNMRIYTIGFKQKFAEEFFNILKNHEIKQLIDIRENNTSQLSGFTKRDDLQYFLKEIIDASYIHMPELAPDTNIREKYEETKNWKEYEKAFLELLDKRDAVDLLEEIQFIHPLVLLCSEQKPDQCHRSLVAGFIKKHIYPDVESIHL
jgi:uncharacterized protein (DUF488 family)